MPQANASDFRTFKDRLVLKSLEIAFKIVLELLSPSPVRDIGGPLALAFQMRSGEVFAYVGRNQNLKDLMLVGALSHHEKSGNSSRRYLVSLAHARRARREAQYEDLVPEAHWADISSLRGEVGRPGEI